MKFNPLDFGAIGNGIVDDTVACQKALNSAVAANGVLYFPGGYSFRLNSPLLAVNCQSKISIIGDGPNVSRVIAGPYAGALSLRFNQLGPVQPWGLNLQNVGFYAEGRAGIAVTISYGDPKTTSDHFQPSTTISNVVVGSNESSSWSGGFKIRSAWNVSMTDVFISGSSAGGQWDLLSGNGIELERMAVNAHFSNVRCNFWANGFRYESVGQNTEGIFFSNCEMIAVQRGVWITGNASHQHPRVSTMTWVGGLIENRIQGVKSVSAAFYLENIWTALISATQFLGDIVPVAPKLSYGVLISNSNGVVVSAVDLNAYSYGIHSVGICKAINSNGNTFTNCEKQTAFPDGTTGSRSYGHTLVNNAPFDWAADPVSNKLGFIN